VFSVPNQQSACFTQFYCFHHHLDQFYCFRQHQEVAVISGGGSGGGENNRILVVVVETVE